MTKVFALKIRTMSCSYRRLSATILTTVYLLMVMGPLTPLAMHSRVMAHAVTGECSGDCRICGCSPEARANNTCCCAKKRQVQDHTHEEDSNTPECCKKKKIITTVIRCGCPCGEKRQVALQGQDSFELLPAGNSRTNEPDHYVTTFTLSPLYYSSRLAEPPVPPPQLG